MAVGDIILGDGVFKINSVVVGLTRGGGQFTVEREYRVIDADGDLGPVKGRIRKVRSTPKLTLNALELTASRMTDLYPALATTTASGTTTLAASTDIVSGDYSTIEWVGETKDGRDVIITINNAINMDNVDLTMTDKEEIVASVTFTGTYDESTRTTEPWKVEWITP